MDLERWIIELLESIKEAGEKGENFDLHLENEAAKEIGNAYELSKWIEIY